jgi:hypothetical protein
MPSKHEVMSSNPSNAKKKNKQKRPKTLKSLEKNTKGKGNNFLNKTVKTQEIIARIDKRASTKLKSFCTAKKQPE